MQRAQSIHYGPPMENRITSQYPLNQLPGIEYPPIANMNPNNSCMPPQMYSATGPNTNINPNSNLNMNMNMNMNGNNNTSTTSHVAKLHNAVRTMKTAFLDLLDATNYTDVNFNDPHVSFAFNMFSKYNNDVDFFNTMQFPIDPLPTMELTHMEVTSPLNGVGLATPPLPGHPYLYNSSSPFLFSMFPSFPNLPTSAFTPSILDNYTEFQRLCYIGASVLRYLIDTTLFQREKNYKSEDFHNVITSIMNEKSLTILCQAYNVEFNYKFIGLVHPMEPYLLFLALFGAYYNTYLVDNGEGCEHWNALKLWAQQLLGYESTSTKTATTAAMKATIATEVDADKNVPQQIQESKRRDDTQFDWTSYIQSVMQDINQSKTASSELVFQTSDFPDLRLGMFECTLEIDGEKFTHCMAMNKKLAKVAAALIASTKVGFFKYLKRSYHEYWKEKYLLKRKEIRNALRRDPRFVYNDDGEDEEDEEDNDQERGHEEGNLIGNVNEGYKGVEDFYTTGGGGGVADRALDSEVTTPAMSPVPSNLRISTPQVGTQVQSSISTIPLSAAKERLYAHYSSKYKITPHYEYEKLSSGLFRATLFLGNEESTAGVATTKKDAAARAAMRFIEKHVNEF
jgi:dsRNA-specific ribonuclease